MNERIEELIKQAGIETYPARLIVSKDDNGEITSKWEIPLEKFAELIIRECCKEIEEEPFNAFAASAWLKQHFGIL